MKVFAILILLGYAVAASYGYGGNNAGASPILIELFTSEGCSSCPPADDWVQKLDAAQPVPGADVIVLSEHVDYWNHDGWKDPYSSASLTERQSSYSHVLKLSDIYTPQIIVDGTAELRLSDPQRTAQILEKETAAPKIPVRIDSISVDGSAVRGQVGTDAASANQDADVYVALTLNHAQSQVLRGENGGKLLTHVAVVQSLKKLGRLETGKASSHDFQLKLKSGTDPGNIRIVAFVQETGQGKVLGAAMKKPPLK